MVLLPTSKRFKLIKEVLERNKTMINERFLHPSCKLYKEPHGCHLKVPKCFTSYLQWFPTVSHHHRTSTSTNSQACDTMWSEAGHLKYTRVLSHDLFEVEFIQQCKRGLIELEMEISVQVDIQNVAPEQILDCTVLGEWNILGDRNSAFILKNMT